MDGGQGQCTGTEFSDSLMKESLSQHGCCRAGYSREAASSGAIQEVGAEWALAPTCFRLTGYGRILYTYSVPDQPRQQDVDRAHQRGSRSRISFIGQVDEGREWGAQNQGLLLITRR